MVTDLAQQRRRHPPARRACADRSFDAEQQIVEMNNGCICCTVRGDLIRILTMLSKRATKLDGIIIETTG